MTRSEIDKALEDAAAAALARRQVHPGSGVEQQPEFDLVGVIHVVAYAHRSARGIRIDVQFRDQRVRMGARLPRR